MSVDEHPKTAYATHDDLREFAVDFKAALRETKNDFDKGLERLGDRMEAFARQQANRDKPNWPLVAILVSIAGLSGALVASQIGNEKESRDAADAAIVALFQGQHDATADRLNRKREAIGKLEERDLVLYEEMGYRRAMDEFHTAHAEEANHPYGVLGEIKELRGLLEQLTNQVQKIDEDGSRRWNSDNPRPAP